MDGFMCGAALLPDGIPDASSDENPCCAGRALEGPRGCECWTEVFDLTQSPIAEGVPVPPVPLRPCEPGPGDDGCAYRGTSPERTGSGGHSGDADELDRLAAAAADPFFCHSGIRRVVALVHEPTGVRWELPDFSDYRPPIAGRVPYRADGRPAMICAGWVLRAAVLARQREDTPAGRHDVTLAPPAG